MANTYHNNPASKVVKIFGVVYAYNPVTKTYSIPNDKQR